MQLKGHSFDGMRKRDIREAIAEEVGLDEVPEFKQYDKPEQGESDRTFTTWHLRMIGQYLDLNMPDRPRYKVHNKIAHAVREITGEKVDLADTSRNYSGLKRRELAALYVAVKEHEPRGLPSQDEIAEKILEETDESEDAAQRIAKHFLERMERYPGGEQLRHGFSIDELEVAQRTRLRVDR
jgi:hypothetical protein